MSSFDIYTESNPHTAAEQITTGNIGEWVEFISFEDPTDPKHTNLVFNGLDTDGEHTTIDLPINTICFDPACCDLPETQTTFTPEFGWMTTTNP